MRLLTTFTFRVGHAFQAHPWMRLLLGAVLVIVGLLALLLGAGHGGLIAAGAFVLAGAVTAIRGKAIPDDRNAKSRVPPADAKDRQP